MIDSAPTLPPREARIFETYLDCEDLPTLCARENLSAQALLAWSAHPAVQAALATLRSLISFQADYHQSAPRLQAIDALRSLLKDTDNPIERRRAATTLVRMPAFPRAAPRASRGIGVPADAPRSNTPKNSQPTPASAPAHPPPVSTGGGFRGSARTERGVPVSVPAYHSPPSPPSPPPLFPRLPDPTPAHLLRTRAGTTCGPP